MTLCSLRWVQTVKNQQATDDKTLELVQTMVEVYSFVEDVESLSQKIKRLENVVAEIAKQTLECAIFLRVFLQIMERCWSRDVEMSMSQDKTGAVGSSKGQR